LLIIPFYFHCCAARLEKLVNADGVNVQLIRGGIPCFVDTTNDNKVSWLPPRWSQEKIQNFLSQVCCLCCLFHAAPKLLLWTQVPYVGHNFTFSCFNRTCVLLRLPSQQCRMDTSKLLVYHSQKSLLHKHSSNSAAIELVQSGDAGAVEDIEAAPEISYFETDAFKKLTAVLLLVLRAFNVVMATLLAVFVPQTCPGVPNSPDIALRENHDCTMEENFTDLILLNKWALAINFVSLSAYLALFFIQYKRERFIVDFLEVDQNKSLENLPIELKEVPHSETRLILRKLNLGMLSLSITAIVLSIINVGLSMRLVFFYYYAGTRSVTVMITNLLLLVSVITGAINNAWVGLHTEQALSCVEIMPVSFNSVDDDEDVLEKEKLLDARKYDFLGIGSAMLDGCFPADAADKRA
jgi:hypothetical protein